MHFLAKQIYQLLSHNSDLLQMPRDIIIAKFLEPCSFVNKLKC